MLQTNVNDGNWHMLTLSTNYEQFSGYRMFLDGRLAAQLGGASAAVVAASPETNNLTDIRVCHFCFTTYQED